MHPQFKSRWLACALALSAAPAAAQTFNQCGTIEAGVTCPKLFRADDQTLWLLDIPLTSFQVGDRVRVVGDEDPFCFTICGQGDGCINNTGLLPCMPLSTGFCFPGAPNATGAPGTISATGSQFVADNDLTLTAESLPPSTFAYFIASRTIGPVIPMPGNSFGNLCLSGAISRFNAQIGLSDATGAYSISTDPSFGSRQFDLGAFPTAMGPVAVVPGDTWHFQCWHRDNQAGQVGSNFTEGFTVQFL